MKKDPELSAAALLLFVVGGGVLLIRAFIFGAASVEGERLASWFCGVVFAFSAFAAYSASRLATKKSDGWTLKAFSFALLILSCLEVVVPQGAFGPLAGFYAALFLVLGHFLRRAFTESSDAVKWVLAGTALYFAGSLWQASADPAAARYLTVQAALRVLGVQFVLIALLSHCSFLKNQVRRVASGRDIGGTIPTVESESTAWVLRRIGTPTRDDVLRPGTKLHS